MKTLFEKIQSLPAGIAAGGWRIHGLVDKDDVLRLVHDHESSKWSTDLPLPGPRRVSIRPELRMSPGGNAFPAVVDCEVYPARPEIGLTVQYKPGGDLLLIDQDWFRGALWSDREVVQDPFEGLVENKKWPFGVMKAKVNV